VPAKNSRGFFYQTQKKAVPSPPQEIQPKEWPNPLASSAWQS
jgi:hypothetical protein